jgi:NADH:ubiquinone oxidoreductase subunit 6 (subunit J)
LDDDMSIDGLAFYIFAGVALASAIGIVVSTNIVRTAVFLLASHSVAGLFLLDHTARGHPTDVYAGTLMLIIFGVMLTSKAWMSSTPRGRGCWAACGDCAGDRFVNLCGQLAEPHPMTTPQVADAGNAC